MATILLHLPLLAEAVDGLTTSNVIQIVAMVMVGAIGALIKMAIDDIKKSVKEVSERLNRNCSRLRRVELDTARSVGRKVRRVRDDVDEDLDMDFDNEGE